MTLCFCYRYTYCDDNGRGLFTYLAVRALKEGEKDKDGEWHNNVELYDPLTDEVFVEYPNGDLYHYKPGQRSISMEGLRRYYPQKFFDIMGPHVPEPQGEPGLDFQLHPDSMYE